MTLLGLNQAEQPSPSFHAPVTHKPAVAVDQASEESSAAVSVSGLAATVEPTRPSVSADEAPPQSISRRRSLTPVREASASRRNNVAPAPTRIAETRPDTPAGTTKQTIPFSVSSSSPGGPALVDHALRRLDRLGEQFDFDMQQEDRLFELLVRKGNRERLPLAIEGEAFPFINQQIVDNAQSSDDLVRAVLRPEQREEAEASWSERDAWWNETVTRIIASRALVRTDPDDPQGGIGGTGRSDEIEGGIGGTGRLETGIVRASSTAATTLPTFLAIYDLDGDHSLSAGEITWMAEQAHGLLTASVLAFDANADGALSASEAATLHAAHHDHVHLVRQTHFRGADQDGDDHLTFAEFIDIPSVTELYRQDPLATVDAFVALHHEQEAVTIDTFVAAIDASAGAEEDAVPGGAE